MTFCEEESNFVLQNCLVSCCFYVARRSNTAMLNCPTFVVAFAWKFSRHFPGQVHGGDGLQYTSQMVAVQEVVDKSEERRVAGQVAFESFAQLLRQRRVAGKLATARVNHFPCSSITHLCIITGTLSCWKVFCFCSLLFFHSFSIVFSLIFHPLPFCHAGLGVDLRGRCQFCVGGTAARAADGAPAEIQLSPAANRGSQRQGGGSCSSGVPTGDRRQVL